MRVIVLGNSGSGKTVLSRSLGAHYEAEVLSLDAVAFQADAVRRELSESVAEAAVFAGRHERWVMEGCYGDIVRGVMELADELIFLNPGTEACLANCRRRPFEPDKFESEAAQDHMLATLLDWVTDYDTRTDEYGVAAHRAVFESFPGAKREFTKLAQYASIERYFSSN